MPQANYVNCESDIIYIFTRKHLWVYNPNLQACQVVTLTCEKLRIQTHFWSLEPGLLKFSSKAPSNAK